MTLHLNLAPIPSSTSAPVPEEEEFYSSWSLFLVCVLLILSLWTSYYLQIKKIKTVHETLVSIFAGMAVGLIVRLAPGTMIREMLVSVILLLERKGIVELPNSMWEDGESSRTRYAFDVLPRPTRPSRYREHADQTGCRHSNTHCFSICCYLQSSLTLAMNSNK